MIRLGDSDSDESQWLINNVDSGEVVWTNNAEQGDIKRNARKRVMSESLATLSTHQGAPTGRSRASHYPHHVPSTTQMGQVRIRKIRDDQSKSGRTRERSYIDSKKTGLQYSYNVW